MVYFVTDGTYTKIGVSSNPLNRIKDLQTSNPHNLKFSYIFKGNVQNERKLHKVFKEYRTESSNEWFDLRKVDVEKVLINLKNHNFNDVDLAKLKAVQLNNEHFRGEVHTSVARKEIVEQYNSRGKENILLKENRRKLIEDIKFHLENHKDKAISYNPYIIKYGFTRNEISFFMRSCKLSKCIQRHNETIFKK